jgi:hypothetical protein
VGWNAPLRNQTRRHRDHVLGLETPAHCQRWAFPRALVHHAQKLNRRTSGGCGAAVSDVWPIDIDSVIAGGEKPMEGDEGLNLMSFQFLRFSGLRMFVTLAALVAAAPSLFGAGPYRYYRFVPTALRDGASANSVQIAEFQLLANGVRLPGAIPSNPGGSNPGNEGPAQANDSSLSTKWLDFTKFNPLVLDFGAPVNANAYRLATANDADERDPVSWRVEGSTDNVNWITLDTQTRYPVPNARQTYLPNFSLPVIAGPTIAFTASPSPMLPGSSSTLAWLVTGADAGTISIEPGIGVVAADGTRAVSPAATTTYTLTATGGGITATSGVTVVVATGGLNSSTYDSLEGDHLLAPLAKLISAVPSATGLQFANIDYNNNFVGNLPGLTGSDSFAVLWSGWFDVSKDGPGDYTFGTQSDDGSVIYLDLDGDGDFDALGELIVDNRGIHPVSARTGTVNLTQDFVRFALGFYEAGGNEAIRGGFKKGSGLDFASLDPINGITGHFQPSQPAEGSRRLRSPRRRPSFNPDNPQPSPGPWPTPPRSGSTTASAASPPTARASFRPAARQPTASQLPTLSARAPRRRPSPLCQPGRSATTGSNPPRCATKALTTACRSRNSQCSSAAHASRAP